MNVFLTIVHIFGLVTLCFSALMSTCWVTSELTNDGAALAFSYGTLITFVLGAFLFLATVWVPKKVSRQAGFLLVASTWSLTPVLCTIPLMIFMPQLSFSDAYFETVSGLTTTGATILSGLDNLPMSINLWRCELLMCLDDSNGALPNENRRLC